MKHGSTYLRRFSLFAVLLALLGGCASEPGEIPEGLSPAEMFQRAQEAVDDEKWEVALRYYEEFIARYPDERGAIVEAEYEIAFITYKQERYAEARTLFEAILADYEADNAGVLPDWPEILSQRLIEIIDERMFEAGLMDLGTDTSDSE